MPHVLVFALGPVQDFIAAARRCRDLWFSSWLVSELSKAAARALAGEAGLENLIFPGVQNADRLDPGSAKTVANKIVARLPEGLDPKAVAGLAEEAARQRLRDLRDPRDGAFGRIQDTLGGGGQVHWETARAQVEELPEIAWAFAPERDGDYRTARRTAEELLAARKTTLLWGPVPWGQDGVPKSSLDGQRESVLDEALFDGVRTGAWSAEEVRRGYGVGPAERLCGVGLLKRHGTRKGSRFEHQFLSTSHLAAWPTLERLEKALPGTPGLRTAWEVYRDELVSLGADLGDCQVPRTHSHAVLGPYDGQLLFESGLLDLFEGVPEPARRGRLEGARRALGAFRRAAGLGEPLPYYAVLMADGDRMGRALERQPSADAHRDISIYLDRFAQLAGGVVEKDHGGELIYAGGDDVLAFVPVHRALACARALVKSFDETIRASPAGRDGEPPTLSVGLGISHFLEPLSHALALARRAEKKAKVERNSLAVFLDKRSGAPVEVWGRWGTVDNDLADFAVLHLHDWLPDGAAFELRELARLLDGIRPDDPALAPLTKLVCREAERILRRKQPAHGAEQELAGIVLDELLERLKTGTSVAALADRLIVARLLAQAELEAALPPAGGTP
jgi:CRISPR-associated protein Cmr2